MGKKQLLTICLCAIMVSWVSAQEPVKAWEDTLEMPTYLVDSPESAPVFERDWSYQRARRSVYPYVLDDNMTRNKEIRPYKAVYLENEYVELCILPEIGGRLFYAIDKTNGKDFFYHQHVVKPANVGMLGAWISGGVEWNVFHHHRATTNLPVDYKIESNADGSKTVWVGETELRHRMQWAIGITLHPGKSYIEVSGRLINSTADNNSMLYWSNVSTKVDDQYQIIFPQSVDFVTFHCKNWFAHWPITHETFNDMEFYRNDVDASWWKNHFMSNSMFVHDLKEDYIAGYDHRQNIGTMITANHHINKGGKFWLWGPNSMWDTKILTDNDGHYIELMMGAYSDNQPDYNWSNPYEVKTFSQYYYGIRDIGGVKVGNKEAAMNLEPGGDGKYQIGINTTSPMKNMTVRLMNGTRKLYTKRVSIDPATPFVENITLDKNLEPYEITMTLTNASGDRILSYTPRKDTSYGKPLPEIVQPPLLPQQIENSEECYLVGLRNLQFYNPFINPVDYFEEVLRRDPGDTRANTMMGVICRKNGETERAAQYLRRAILRQTKDYTRPKDCEALYNLGLILKEQGKYTEAMDTLYRATWNYTYNSAANYQLAQMYASVHDYTNSLERLEEAIINNGNNYNALNLKASIMRVTGNPESAMETLERVLKSNPLNAYAAYEKDIINGTLEHRRLMRDEIESYIELALQYLHNGFPSEAEKILVYIDTVKAYPSVKMWLAYLADGKGDRNRAEKFFGEAMELPVEFCNPFRLEMVPVLEMAKKYCPSSEKPYYYLGCLLYNKQPDNAAAEWRICIEINPQMHLAWRNLGWYSWLHTKNYEEAARCYAQAVEIAPEKALYLEEQEQVLEMHKVDVDKRYEILKRLHKTALKRYYPLAQEVVTGTFVGDYDYVLHLLETCYFPTREGVANFHDVYVDALLMAGYKKSQEGNGKEALALYEKAFEYPENHQVFLVDERTPRDAQIYAFIAEAYEQMGQRSKARQNWIKASKVDVRHTDFRYWKGVALRKLGKKEDADALFNVLVKAGEEAVVDQVINFYGAEGTTGSTVEDFNAKAYYTQGLGRLGLGDRAEAHALFEKSFALKYDNLWTKYMLNLTK